MTTAATSSPSPPPPLSHSSPTWSPSPNDHLIFKWIKLDGKSQSWVASAFGISQPTVSRIIQRYERWQAHATDREDGRLDHSERLRAQRWLTYERNELILANCLRIAQEMEGFKEVSKSTVSRSTLHPNDPGNFRTENAMIDRSGVASRFLRLAFRINMEQFKLASLDPTPPALPLSADELAELDSEAAATAQEIEGAKKRSADQARAFTDNGWPSPASYPNPDNPDATTNDPLAWPAPPPPSSNSPHAPSVLTPPAPPTLDLGLQTLDSVPSDSLPASPLVTPQPEGPPSSSPTPTNTPLTPTLDLGPGKLDLSQPANLVLTLSPSLPPSVTLSPASSTLDLGPQTLDSSPSPIHPLNNLNNDATPQIAATSTPSTNYEIPASTEKFLSLNNDYPSDIPLTILTPPKVDDSGVPAQRVAEPPEPIPTPPLQTASTA